MINYRESDGPVFSPGEAASRAGYHHPPNDIEQDPGSPEIGARKNIGVGGDIITRSVLEFAYVQYRGIPLPEFIGRANIILLTPGLEPPRPDQLAHNEVAIFPMVEPAKPETWNLYTCYGVTPLYGEEMLGKEF